MVREPMLIGDISTFIETALTPEDQVNLDDLDPSMLAQPSQGRALRTEHAAVIRYARRAGTVEVERLHASVTNTRKALVDERT
jgi:hypothetical protein